MNTVERIVEEVKALPEFQAREVLDFVGYLKAKRAYGDQAVSAPQFEDVESDWAEFEKLAGTWQGKFNRDECYDRKILR
jgi:hypothetical protein